MQLILPFRSDNFHCDSFQVFSIPVPVFSPIPVYNQSVSLQFEVESFKTHDASKHDLTVVKLHTGGEVCYDRLPPC